jgi:Secretion system C-terminal sorting domain
MLQVLLLFIVLTNLSVAQTPISLTEEMIGDWEKISDLPPDIDLTSEFVIRKDVGIIRKDASSFIISKDGFKSFNDKSFDVEMSLFKFNTVFYYFNRASSGWMLDYYYSNDLGEHFENLKFSSDPYQEITMFDELNENLTFLSHRCSGWGCEEISYSDGLGIPWSRVASYYKFYYYFYNSLNSEKEVLISTLFERSGAIFEGGESLVNIETRATSGVNMPSSNAHNRLVYHGVNGKHNSLMSAGLYSLWDSENEISSVYFGFDLLKDEFDIEFDSSSQISKNFKPMLNGSTHENQLITVFDTSNDGRYFFFQTKNSGEDWEIIWESSNELKPMSNYYDKHTGNLWVIASDGENNYLLRKNVVSVLTSVSENNFEENVVYPNPCSDFINISNFGLGDFEIYNIYGVKVDSGKTFSGRINVRSLSFGTYFLDFDGKVYKFIKN